VLRLERFDLCGLADRVVYVETVAVRPGVTCDVYRFATDQTWDLAVVEVHAGHKTPHQRVVDGETTIEGRIAGQGVLTVSNQGNVVAYEFRDDEAQPVSVKQGEQMQWHADTNEPLYFFELCNPPYADGRFEDLPEE
jgi:hypothetical protein